MFFSFLPDGIYLDATKLGVEELAKEIYDSINDPQRYYDFFKWHGYYSFHEAAVDKYSYSVCELCAFLNKKKNKHERTVRVYENITDWWNVPIPGDFPFIDSFREYFAVEPTTNLEPVEATTSLVSKLWDFILDF